MKFHDFSRFQQFVVVTGNANKVCTVIWWILFQKFSLLSRVKLQKSKKCQILCYQNFRVKFDPVPTPTPPPNFFIIRKQISRAFICAASWLSTRMRKIVISCWLQVLQNIFFIVFFEIWHPGLLFWLFFS